MFVHVHSSHMATVATPQEPRPAQLVGRHATATVSRIIVLMYIALFQVGQELRASSIQSHTVNLNDVCIPLLLGTNANVSLLNVAAYQQFQFQ